MTETTPDTRTDPPALSLDGITKTFGNVVALKDVSFFARDRRITSLLGENGAGKTTLMRIAFGLVQPDAGSVSLNGVTVQLQTPSDAIKVGIGMVHQQFSLVPSMTVAENVALGGHGRFSFERVVTKLKTIDERTGLRLDPFTRVMDLSNAERQRLEIIRAFAHDARILILDEPTSVLTPADRADLFRELRAFADRDNAVILITHKLSDALQHSDDITVLRRGQVVLAAPARLLTQADLTSAMLGTANIDTQIPKAHDRTVNVIARLDDVFIRRSRPAESGLQNVSMTINAGEVLGVAALEGDAAELLRVLARRSLPIAGTARLPNRIAFVPENRPEEGIIPSFTLTENLALGDSGVRTGLIDWSEFRASATEIVKKYQVSASDVDVAIAQLSGGNQQRFVIGRELRNNPELIILENPTQGLDVSASAFVYTQIRQAKKEGAAIVFYSTDIDELAEIADRVVVISATGAQEVPADRRAIGNALLGAAPEG